MTSTVTNYSSKINTSYPVAGTSNDSRSLRDNFSNIQTALNVAASEISNLQINGLNLDKPVNDLAFSSILTQALIQNSGLVANNNASVALNTAGQIEIDYTLGSYQKTVVAATSTFIVVNWPKTGVFSNVRLEVVTTTPSSIDFNPTTGTLRPDNSVTLPYNSSVNATTVWDIWTSDNGSNVFVKFVGGFN